MTTSERAARPQRDLTDARLWAVEEDPEVGLKEPVFENIEIPEHFGPVRILIDDYKIKRYAFTVNDYGAFYLEGDPAFGKRIGHATLLGNDLLQLFTTRYSASRVVGLHTEEQLWFVSPAYIDETVEIEAEYVEAYERRGQGYVVMEAEARGTDGRTLIRHRGVEIMRAAPGEIVGRASSSNSGSGRVTGELDPKAGTISRAGADIAAGMGLVRRAVEVTQEQASVFSRAGEYVRNIHNNLEIARRGGLRLPIVQGQQLCCLISSYLTDMFGADWFTSGWLRVKFLSPVEVFEPIEIGGVVTDVSPSEAVGRLDVRVEVWIRRSEGRLATVGWARCGAFQPTACC